MQLNNKIKNSVWTGLGIGMLIPAILGGVAWYLIHQVRALSQADLLYIGAIAVNAPVMQYFFKIRKDNAARGVLAATFICAFVFYFYKVL